MAVAVQAISGVRGGTKARNSAMWSNDGRKSLFQHDSHKHNIHIIIVIVPTPMYHLVTQ